MNNQPRIVIICGSARKDGEAAELVKQLVSRSGWDVIDLNDHSFSHFDYEHLNRDDDFLPLMRQIIPKYEILVFMTPVYWYAMSGIMKIFFDRITDLLTIEKDLGRKLRGKKIAAITTSYGNNLGENFWLPFSETAKYLGMEFITGTHTVVGQEEQESIRSFITKVNSSENHTNAQVS